MSTTPIRLAYALNPGDQLGPYKIVRPLGAGGMGEVYLAEHVQLRKQYAIKILPAELSNDPNFLDRFRIEARVMADLEDTHIVRVHNFGDEKGRYFLVMDYVEGPDGNPRTLEDELAWGRNLPETAVKEIALQICDALAYAHGFKGEGVIHRDLKPANILIARPTHQTEGGYAIKISDFGLAKILGADYIRAVLERSTTLTGIKTPLPLPDDGITERAATPASAGFSLLGTYDYMSPEQKVGAGIDARSDMFSVGIILYRMLTGHKPEGAFDPPSKKGVNRAWDAIVAKCLQREASRRYPSIAALRADILRVGIPVYKTTRFLAVCVLGSLVTAVVATHLLGRSQTGRPPEPASAAVAPPPAAPPTAIPATPEPVVEQAKPDVAPSPPPPAPSPTAVPEPAPSATPEPTPSATPEPAPQPIPVGKLHVSSDPGVQVVAKTADNVVLRLGVVPEQGVLKDIPLPEGAYTLQLSRSNYRAQSFNIIVSDGRDVDIDARLEGLPGRIRVESERPVEIFLNGKRVGRSGEIITNVPPGAQIFRVQAGNFRGVMLETEIPPNELVTVQAPALEAVRAVLRIRAEPVARYQSAKLPTRARVRVGREDWQTVELPYAAAVNNIHIQQVIALEMDSYQRPDPQSVMVSDGQTLDVIFKLEPLPVSVLFSCNTEAGVVAVRQTEEMSFFKSARKLTGIGAIKGRTGEKLAMEPFQKYRVEITAPNYAPQTLDVYYDQPGRDYREAVKLVPLPRTPAETERNPFQRPRAH